MGRSCPVTRPEPRGPREARQPVHRRQRAGAARRHGHAAGQGAGGGQAARGRDDPAQRPDVVVRDGRRGDPQRDDGDAAGDADEARPRPRRPGARAAQARARGDLPADGRRRADRRGARASARRDASTAAPGAPRRRPRAGSRRGRRGMPSSCTVADPNEASPGLHPPTRSNHTDTPFEGSDRDAFSVVTGTAIRTRAAPEDRWTASGARLPTRSPPPASIARPSKTTVTGTSRAAAKRSRRSTSRRLAPARSRHHPSGRLPTTLSPSTTHSAVGPA